MKDSERDEELRRIRKDIITMLAAVDSISALKRIQRSLTAWLQKYGPDSER